MKNANSPIASKPLSKKVLTEKLYWQHVAITILIEEVARLKAVSERIPIETARNRIVNSTGEIMAKLGVAI